jgi:phenylpyruvate tautomerase PptA (4-oxalocrotonate tautomerase family)
VPTYVVTAPATALSVPQKRLVAAGITRVHCEVTAGASYFVQVVFNDVKLHDYYVAGRQLRGRQISVHGHIRAGHTLRLKKVLVSGLMNAVARAAKAKEHQVWVYVGDLPAFQMAELGHVLPEPGKEARWAATLSADDRKRILVYD